MYDMRAVAPTVCKVLGIRMPSSAQSSHIPLVVDSLGTTDRLVVIVIDAFGVSTWKKGREKVPTVNQLESMHGTIIHSVMKSITPVNFATMLTGASPETHRITDREKPLRLETIFDVMRESELRSATAARALSSLGILISPHADAPGIAESNLDVEVTEITVKNLQYGFNLVWVQLLDVDDAGHAFGPYSDESMKALIRVDKNLGRILAAAKDNDYSVIVLADHGQHDSINGKYMGSHGTNVPEDLEVPFLWAKNNELCAITYAL
jgi:predicted AlkP superfamily pyrophosphatase or phosphodiesterase